MPDESILSFVSFRNLQPLIGFYPESANAQTDRPCEDVVCFVPSHFLHNVLTSVLILPTSLTLDDLRHTLKESHQYWRPDWSGSFTPSSFLILILNIFFVVLGIILAWNQHRLVGLLPLAVFIIYNVSNGFARTSGGRYIVPIDWIIVFYFLIGVLQTILLFASALGRKWTLFSRPTEQSNGRQSFFRNDLSRGIVILAILFGLGALVPLAETLHADRYQNFDVSKALTEHEEQINRAGLSRAEIDLFLQNPNAEITVGRALYPRYYIENEGEVHFQPYVARGFPRTTFALIGTQGEKGIILPSEKPDYFPHAVDTLVIGCKEQFYVDALAVIILDETGTVYTRSPESPLQCPLKEPVCDNNHNCY